MTEEEIGRLCSTQERRSALNVSLGKLVEEEHLRRLRHSLESSINIHIKRLE